MEKVKALNLIGIAYRAKKIVNGYESVMATVTSGKAKCVITCARSGCRLAITRRNGSRGSKKGSILDSLQIIKH